MKHAILPAIFALLLLCTCTDRDNYLNTKGEVYGYIPVYGDTFGTLKDSIRSVSPQTIHHAGKIYLYRSWLFINEQGRGVHVYDNSDPASPLALCFIRIPGNHDISCKDSTLFAESRFGLVHFNIAALPLISDIVFMDPDFAKFANGQYYIPPFYDYPARSIDGQYYNYGRKTYFECIDPTKGYVTGWTFGRIHDPKCHKEHDYYEE